LPKSLSSLKVYGFEHEGFVAVLDNTHTYYQASMALLDKEVRKDLFNKDRPILTKTRDDMPTRYGIEGEVKNSLIGDGCIIEGTVKNSILFRGVKVAKGAVVENCILMQETVVENDAVLDNVIADKNSVISEKMVLKGTTDHHCFVAKSQIV
jgi:glucose-1-phosphate adenylyltransferase